MNAIGPITPWEKLLQVIAPHYSEGDRGRPPKGLERMLPMYVAQQCLGLSDEGIEDAVYDSHAVRRFVGVDLGADEVPDATTLLKFRRLLQVHELTRAIFEAINVHLRERGLTMHRGTVVDATLIAAPSSTKNARGERDPEMHQTKKGNQWYFVSCAHPACGGTAGLRQRPAAPTAPGGVKAHVGADAASGLVHTVVTTAANVADVTQAHRLLHGQETDVFADAGYLGADKRPENQGKSVTWHVAMRPGKRRALDKTTSLGRVMDALERGEACIRAKVEHAFHVVKNLFRHKKARYRGLRKNGQQLLTLFALANLVLARRWLLGTQGLGASAAR
ncbi:IS5 family transposase [Tepidimonas charontis]|uniref:Transposase DDE domain protein n=1 Tax=Tepidimonas charontis TaxID=2267262 RepID=A0A554XJJ0_9BURK|nr:IS5 family transposase [Tepidimonas charontis]TSE35958.1 Transposase DDE domain protein [Tepidimonas charontis]